MPVYDANLEGLGQSAHAYPIWGNTLNVLILLGEVSTYCVALLAEPPPETGKAFTPKRALIFTSLWFIAIGD
jgi:hypothetical protein